MLNFWRAKENQNSSKFCEKKEKKYNYSDNQKISDRNK